MKVYLAGERAYTPENLKLLLGVQKRRLFSYYYHGSAASQFGRQGELSPETQTAIDAGLELFLDCGAFTAFTKNVTIDLADYAEFVRRHGKHYSAISSLDDTTKHPEISYKNLKELEKLGVKSCPVYHAREPVEWLERYIDEGHDYIFLGGLVPETTAWLKEWLDQLWDTHLTNKDGTPRVRVHGFGLTTLELLVRYPWYSVDSSSWLMIGVYGGIVMRRGKRLFTVAISNQSKATDMLRAQHFAALSKMEQSQIRHELAKLHITPEQCSETYVYRDIVNAWTFQNLEDLGPSHFIRQNEGFFAS